MTAIETTKRCIVFVLASWQMDAPAGIEKATAALAAGLAARGHTAVIVTAAKRSRAELPGVTVEYLELPVTFPCSDDVLRTVITENEALLEAQVRQIISRHQADTIVFTDALWGLGRLQADLPAGVRRVLAVHVLPHKEDMIPAQARADVIVTPSPFMQAEARKAGWCTPAWRAVPNALLCEPRAPSPSEEAALPSSRPVRMLARLGHEKGIVPLLTAAARCGVPHRLEVVLAQAGFEGAEGTQERLLAACQAIADRNPHISLDPNGLAWNEVHDWLADAAVVIVPSLKESFGLVALEAMSVGTPVVAYRIGNLPALLNQAPHPEQLLADPADGPDTLLHLAERLLADPVTYRRTSKAMYHLAQDYRPPRIATIFLKAVS